MFDWLLAALFLVPAALAFLLGRDAWPFSHYPMFAARATVADLVVFRIAIEDREGRVRWWRPRFFRMQDQLVDRFDALMRSDARAAGSPDMLPLFARTLRIMQADGPVLSDATAVLFVRRRARLGAGGFAADDAVVARLPVPQATGTRSGAAHE
jgi:hypothetical protein